eukprot:6938039-Alexandrium_andersonii.AAC.1
MARARLIQDPVRRPSDDAAQQFHRLQVRRASPEAPLDLARELPVHQLLNDVHVGVIAREGEVCLLYTSDAADDM